MGELKARTLQTCRVGRVPCLRKGRAQDDTAQSAVTRGVQGGWTDRLIRRRTSGARRTCRKSAPEHENCRCATLSTSIGISGGSVREVLQKLAAEAVIVNPVLAKITAPSGASDRVCGKRLKVMIPTLLPALEQHGRLQLGQPDRDRVLVISAATIDRLLVDVKIAASGGRRRRAGFYSAIRREVPIRTFNDWNSPPPGFCEVDMVAHGGTSVAGSFIQTLTMVDVATGWTECLPLVTREGSLVVEAINRAQSLFPWLLRGVDFDNDSAFMNDVVVPWCREQKLEVTRSRAYKKNDQAFVEQKNGAVVRRLMGYGRFDGVETARVMGRLYAAARLYVNFFQPSFKLKEKRREGAKVIKRYHLPSTPYERALAHPKVTAAVKKRLRDQYRSLDPVALLAEIRATQDELGNRVDRRAGQVRRLQSASTSTAPATTATFAKTLGKTTTSGESRATHRRTRRPYKTRVRMPSKLDPHIAAIEGWLGTQPQLTALAIVDRLREKHPEEFGTRQHSIVQRLLRALRRKMAEQLFAKEPLADATTAAPLPGVVDGSGYVGPDPPTAPLIEQAGQATWRGRSVEVASTSAMAPSG
ncbi:transposase family protein [Bradyrhizobium sp. 183]|uniref:integrase catalytic domain-containing protein n=1 Tax=unclassified Bradyrhizobium TaxID=2631580 RepID=UPI001FFA57B0|nr:MULTISPECIES: DDE-type integrase/transposase/recombinase [unclassified Bradyrhizobium]MCK1553530.1 transposase family protein [Bradyrhizobium sp. 177]MCK1563403.1 transposase family protein [Bradyrhizobium sp. 173]MCK1604621.1 transposase family protein [Bradyrhizobium sp. 166]UPJ79114.1 transposase family protein [Bradyrhizobium sp. 184]UPJ86907.1 transposase family protein [Bradyrhizobium sp. 183]